MMKVNHQIKRKETALNFLLGEDEIVNKDCPENEVDSFIDEKQYPSDTDVLNWWKLNSSKYPLLSSLAKRYLSTPATSIPAERFFSASGLTVNQQRACLCRLRSCHTIAEDVWILYGQPQRHVETNLLLLFIYIRTMRKRLLHSSLAS